MRSNSWLDKGARNLVAFTIVSLTRRDNVGETLGQPENSETNVSGTDKHSVMCAQHFSDCPFCNHKVLICESGRRPIGYFSVSKGTVFFLLD